MADPVFVNACPPKDGMEHAGNYRLRSDSPCREAGAPIKNNGLKDFWKNALYNGKPVFGALEYRPGPSQGAGPAGDAAGK